MENNTIEFLTNLFKIVMKGIDYYRGTIYNGTLYIIAMDGILYTIDTTSFFSFETSLDFEKRSKETLCIYEQKTYIRDEVLSIANNVNMYTKSSSIYYEPKLRENENFESVVTAKSDEGAGKFYMHTSLDHPVFIYLYRNIFNLSKPDTVSLEVFNLNDGRLLSKFIMFKKKLNININIYMIFADNIANFRRNQR